MKISSSIIQICEAAQAAGGRAWVVGGAVRDALMGMDSKDIDIEIHEVEADKLADALKKLGSINEIGKSFGVFKLVFAGDEFDISIPRRDSQQGPAHNDVAVVGDPHMGLSEAARRRDLTINAIAYDPLADTYEDPWGGIQDIERGRLAAVDPRTFVEDPLRVLRVMQFAARFGFPPDPDLVELCIGAELSALPAERLWGEFEKLLMRSPLPSVGWSIAHELHILKKVLPEISGLPVETVGVTLDRAAGRRSVLGDPGRSTALMLAAMLHNTEPHQAESTLKRLGVFRLHGYPVRKRVLQSTSCWREVTESADDTTLRRLAEDHDLTLLTNAAWSATARQTAMNNLERAIELGIATEPMPALLKGRDLRQLGVEPGPEMGERLQEVRNAQLEGIVTDKASALLWLEGRLP